MGTFDLTKELMIIKNRLEDLKKKQNEMSKQELLNDYLILQTMLRRLMKTVHFSLPQEKDKMLRENLEMIRVLSQEIAVNCIPESDEEILKRRQDAAHIEPLEF